MEETAQQIKKRIPMAEDQLVEVCSLLSAGEHSLMTAQVRQLFDMYDSDTDNSLSLNELACLLQDIGNKITTLPAVRSSPP